MTTTADFDTIAALVTATDTSPRQAQADEDSYCEAILPMMDGEPMVDAFDFDREEERATHQEPIPGHWHYMDRGYWC